MNKAICRHCHVEHPFVTYDGRARFVNHRLPERYVACEGSGALVEASAEDYDGPTEFKQFGELDHPRRRQKGKDPPGSSRGAKDRPKDPDDGNW